MRTLALLSVAAIFCSCAIGPNFKRPETALADKWMAEGRKQIVGQPSDQTEWWRAFNDPTLDALVAQAQSQNLTLQAAALRIVQARAVRSGAFWTEFPLISGPNASYTDFHYSQNVKPDLEFKKGSFDVYRNGRRERAPRRGRIILQRRLDRPDLGVSLPQVEINKPELQNTNRVELYQAGFDALWELDVWGQKRRLIEAAGASYQGAIADYDGILVSLTAEVAAAYIEIRTLEERLRTTREDIAALEQFLAAAQGRAREGQVTDLDVQMARTLLTDTQAEIPTLESDLRVAENTLCILLAKPPQSLRQELGGPRPIPAPPAEVAAGIPADLLRRRPDVRMAEYEAWAQCARIGVAKGELLPKFALLGSIGFASSHTGNFFERNSFRSLYGGGINWTPLIYPFTIEPVRVQDARYQEAIALYRETVLRALAEVEDSSARFLSTQDALHALAASAEASRRAAGLALDQYARGTLPYPGAVEALQRLVDQQDRAIQMRGDVALNLVALYKALGGGWQRSRDKPLLPEAVRKQMEQRTDWWSFSGKREIEPREFKKPQ